MFSGIKNIYNYIVNNYIINNTYQNDLIKYINNLENKIDSDQYINVIENAIRSYYYNNSYEINNSYINLYYLEDISFKTSKIVYDKDTMNHLFKVTKFLLNNKYLYYYKYKYLIYKQESKEFIINKGFTLHLRFIYKILYINQIENLNYHIISRKVLLKCIERLDEEYYNKIKYKINNFNYDININYNK